jgi:hypothetical protein
VDTLAIEKQMYDKRAIARNKTIKLMKVKEFMLMRRVTTLLQISPALSKSNNYAIGDYVKDSKEFCYQFLVGKHAPSFTCIATS